MHLQRLHRASRAAEREEGETGGEQFRCHGVWLVLGSVLCTACAGRITKPPSASKGGLMEKYIKVRCEF